MGEITEKRSAAGWHFLIKAENGQVIATSECYSSAAACRKGMESVLRCAPTAPIWDQTDPAAPAPANPRFEVFRDKAGHYRFRLRSRNSRIIAASEGYETRSACLGGITSLRRNVHGQTDEISGE